MKRTIWLFCIIIFLILFFIVLFSSYINEYFTISENQVYTAPTKEQVSIFMNYCMIDDNDYETCNLLLTSKSPHMSDSYMAIITSFNNDLNWENGIVYTGELIPKRKLCNDIEFLFDAEIIMGPFQRAYRLVDKSEILIVVSNVPGNVIDQIISAN